MAQGWRSLLVQSRFALKRFWVVLVLGFLGAIALSWGQHGLLAIEANLQATGNSWQGASFPLENFQGYTSPFGYRMSPDGSYSREFHRGLDMAAPEGSYIRSWWTGKVVEVSDNSACGTSVVIESGSWEHIYCHMQGSAGRDGQGKYIQSGDVRIYEGQMLPAGERIGRVGMTGRTTGPHLHWGLKYSSQWVDPALVLRAMYAEQGRG
ncbi:MULTISPECIES: M23 family metallopeptidase [Leptolyngbya]|jgi:murein DD-endopeptidase MepM/ murein hydrolase activator NlpD|uniref:Peptidase M23 domain-containing protein n=2 Tax=Leptolyngbya boryana TaxID=1184 RepID=A0A1Z4JBN7_LEPBY|nr:MULTISPECIES: M23 family metallopeptidase [Leptolyngbya]MBD2376033.1 M23 family metallopeptidase [Leptolyngbya sp. FACHB-238]MBD2406850.1 M23 family metallopeptidase [Leptolyngbya sp. FACHB-402]BAY54110.1 peptidase M23 domain-containing protein [Leptolyngbya boryana NIES-2135]MBD1856068.1 M23 family metallopeptidase [Leptolyngbya sp. FACHB-1624]MBD2369766.1 M23 family metallopeptidase [Leptolyngbya sp. FACHB-161]